jgi:hypothetical protein
MPIKDPTWDQLMSFSNDLLRRVRTRDDGCPVCKAMNLLIPRIVNACNSIRVLTENAGHDFGCDGAVILRGLYDAALQAQYILAKPDLASRRAELYLDFFWVERFTRSQRVYRNTSTIAEYVKNSPNRAGAEPINTQQYLKVRDRYLTRKKKDVRQDWYPGSLRDLAEDAGYEVEYDLVQSELSSSVHSTPLALQYGSAISPENLLSWGWLLSMRVVCHFALYKGVELTDEETWVYEKCRKFIIGEGAAPSSQPA